MERVPNNPSQSGQAAPANSSEQHEVLHGADSLGLIWDTVVSDPATGVSLIDKQGLLLFINEQAMRFFFSDGKMPKDVIGKTLAELGFPEQWIEERITICCQIEGTGESVLLRTVWQGHQQFSWMRHIPAANSIEHERFLVITRRIVAGHEAEHLLQGEHEVIKSDYIRLGKLDILTSRELEVLSLVGNGMSTKEIAKVLFRSAKTIENHRDSIAKKLGRVKGVELARIAREAGLRTSDTERKRV
jgi:DNA-binding CsgD family transcriptional regulator